MSKGLAKSIKIEHGFPWSSTALVILVGLVLDAI